MTLIRPAATFSRGEKENHAPAPLPAGEGWGEGAAPNVRRGRNDVRWWRAVTLIRPAATFSRGEKENHAPAPSPRGRGVLDRYHFTASAFFRNDPPQG